MGCGISIGCRIPTSGPWTSTNRSSMSVALEGDPGPLELAGARLRHLHGNFGYTFRKDWPHVLSEPPRDWTAYKERNPVGSYRRKSNLPAPMARGGRLFITFDGVDRPFSLWVNGQKVGYSVNSRNAAEFDITSLVRPGKNLLAAEVYRYSAGSYLEDQDMWRLSGIFRNVTLWTLRRSTCATFSCGPIWMPAIAMRRWR